LANALVLTPALFVVLTINNIHKRLKIKVLHFLNIFCSLRRYTAAQAAATRWVSFLALFYEENSINAINLVRSLRGIHIANKNSSLLLLGGGWSVCGWMCF